MPGMADDIHAQVCTWIASEIDKTGLGETYGYAVTWDRVAVQGPQGQVIIPAWHLLLTCRSPLLGQGDLFHLADLGVPRPVLATVRSAVAEGVGKLRDLAASKLAGTGAQPS